MVDESVFGGFGGGSPDEQPQQGAIPDDTAQWGQSLGQDIQNVGKAVGAGLSRGAASDVASSSPQVSQAQSNDFGQSLAPRIMNYISGKGAMSSQQWDQLSTSVDPQGTMDQNERTMRAIDSAMQQDPNLGAAALQHSRVNYDLYKANAAKALASGNGVLAAQEATAAHNYVPDGSKTVFAPFKDGFVAGVWTPDGQQQKFVLSKDQFNQMLRGDHGLFDNVAESTSPRLLDALSKAGGAAVAGPSGSGGNTPFGGSNTDQGQAAGTPTQFPGNQPGSTEGSLIGNEQDIKSLQNQKNARNPNDAGIHEGGRTTLPLPGEAQHEAAFAAERANRQTRSNVAQYVAQATGRPVAHNAQDELNQAHENQMESQRVAGEGATQRARIQSAGRQQQAQTRADATVKGALIRAQAVTSGNDQRFNGEQARTAATILNGVLKNGGSLEDAIGQMQKQKIHPDLINHLVASGQQQGQQQPQQRQSFSEGQTATNPRTGEQIVFRNGKWQAATQ